MNMVYVVTSAVTSAVISAVTSAGTAVPPVTSVLYCCTVVMRQVKEDYFGCFSWVDLTDVTAGGQLSLAGATPAISDAVWADKQKLLREKLAAVEAQPLEL